MLRCKELLERWRKVNESVIDGMTVTGPLVQLYEHPEKLANELFMGEETIRNLISDVIGHTPHSQGVKIEIDKKKKEVKADISKLSGDSKYLKRNKVDQGDKLDSEKELDALSYMDRLLKHEDGESKEGAATFNVADMFEVIKQLSILSQILKTMGVEMPDVQHAHDELQKIQHKAANNKSEIEQKELIKVLKELDLQKIFKDVAGYFSKFSLSDRQIKYGRKAVDLEQILKNYLRAAQALFKDLVRQGLDINQVKS